MRIEDGRKGERRGEEKRKKGWGKGGRIMGDGVMR
jgi:hypothetical protein